MSSWGSDLPIQFSYGCCWISKEPLELLVQFLQFLHKHCSSFCPTLLHELIKVSPTSRQTKHAQALQPFFLRFTAFLYAPCLFFPLLSLWETLLIAPSSLSQTKVGTLILAHFLIGLSLFPDSLFYYHSTFIFLPPSQSHSLLTMFTSYHAMSVFFYFICDINTNPWKICCHSF